MGKIRKRINKMKKAKKGSEHDCFNCCSNCGAKDNKIEWGDKEWMDTEATQIGECTVCGCIFEEVYEYTYTFVVEEGK